MASVALNPERLLSAQLQYMKLQLCYVATKLNIKERYHWSMEMFMRVFFFYYYQKEIQVRASDFKFSFSVMLGQIHIVCPYVCTVKTCIPK